METFEVIKNRRSIRIYKPDPVLAATSLGPGTVYIGLIDTQKAASVLQIPDNYEVVTMTPLGYPEYQPNPRPRKALKDIVYREKFGQTLEFGV